MQSRHSTVIVINLCFLRLIGLGLFSAATFEND